MKKRFICIPHYPNTTDSFAPTVYFKKHFNLEEVQGEYFLSVCALGIGYCYLNGERISADLFTAPVSDYRKTLWVNRYEVTKLLKIGNNELLVEVGNGFYNEGVETVWGHHMALWRGIPTLSLTVYQGGKELFSTDEGWETALSNCTIYNQLYSGEHFDFQGKDLPMQWVDAVKNITAPKGRFRLCKCPPIREFEHISPINIQKSKKGWIFDFGKNISGYTQIDIFTKRGQVITLSHAEDIDGKGNLKYNGLDIYQKSPFQQDKIIGNGQRVIWKPKFTYHGFRYVEVEGLIDEPNVQTLTAIFVHQDIKKTGDFVCSDKTLNEIYQAGIASTYSNMFYMLTDCPTREKLGWTNDAQASLEQIMFNFRSERFFEKWSIDICDTMNEEGDLAGIAPTPDWGYGHGPVCNGIIFTLPYLLYNNYGNKKAVKYALPYMKRYFSFLQNSGTDFHLNDWGKPKSLDEENYLIEKEFIRKAYLFIFSRIFISLGKPYEKEYGKAKRELLEYIINGRCKIAAQTAISVCIVLGIGEKATLARQLVEVIKQDGGKLNCGMFGIQFLFKALKEIGQADLAYEMIEREEEPSYKAWLNQGATTLWESFCENKRTMSKNHHMFSCVLYFFIEGICGLRQQSENVFSIEPSYVRALTFAKCTKRTKGGGISVEWQKSGNQISLKISTKGNVTAWYGEECIKNTQKTICIEI